MSAVQDFPGVVVVGVTQKPTRNGGTQYMVALNNGMSPSTFDAALATKAHGLAGQPAVARLEEKPNPRGGRPYINILDIAPAGQALGGGDGVAFGGQQAAAAFGAPAQAVPFGGQAQAPAFGQAAPTMQFPDVSAEKDRQMARGYALSSAAVLFAGLYTGAAEAVDDTELLTKILRFAGAFEHYRNTGLNVAEAVTQAAPVEATPEAVAAAVNAAAPGAVQIGAPVEAAVEEQPQEAVASGIPWKQ